MYVWRIIVKEVLLSPQKSHTLRIGAEYIVWALRHLKTSQVEGTNQSRHWWAGGGGGVKENEKLKVSRREANSSLLIPVKKDKAAACFVWSRINLRLFRAVLSNQCQKCMPFFSFGGLFLRFWTNGQKEEGEKGKASLLQHCSVLVLSSLIPFVVTH